jgi:hypothetical protein
LVFKGENEDEEVPLSREKKLGFGRYIQHISRELSLETARDRGG